MPTDSAKNKKKILLCILIAIAAVLGLVIFAFIKLGVKNYTSPEQFRKAGGSILFEIPDNASDCRYAVYKSIGSKGYFYSFELDKDSFEKYIADNHTSDESKWWYGRKVKDCNDPEYEFDDFPAYLPFESVTDDPIENYEVIRYDPLGIGTASSGTVIDPDTYRVVVYNYKTIR